MNFLEESLLGKNVPYEYQYNPQLLYPIPRAVGREKTFPLWGLDPATTPPFWGYDIWNAYEISWLDAQRRPHVAIGEIICDSHSPFLVESKSLKLYLNSLNDSIFEDATAVAATIGADLSNCLKSDVEVRLYSPEQWAHFQPQDGLAHSDAVNIDALLYSDIPQASPSTDLASQPSIRFGDEITTQHLYSHLVRSLCPITGQPDWATLHVQSTGRCIDGLSLAKYLVSKRDQAMFHERCVEEIFMALLFQGSPQELTVWARYTRRGGIDINPYRSTKPVGANARQNVRNIRQ